MGDNLAIHLRVQRTTEEEIDVAAAVYEALEGERRYQEEKWEPVDGALRVHSALEWLVYIEDYVNEAKKILARRPEVEAREFALHTIRKIGGMAVACMEQNGVRTRGEEGPRPVGYTEK